MQRISRDPNPGTEALVYFPSELEILVYASHGSVKVLIPFTRPQIYGAGLRGSNANICFLCNQQTLCKHPQRGKHPSLPRELSWLFSLLLGGMNPVWMPVRF